MNQLDFVGDLPPTNANALRAVRNTRPSSAEEKAQQLFELGRLCQTPPPEGQEWIGQPDAGVGRLFQSGQGALPEHAGIGRAVGHRDQEHAAVSLK